MSHKASGDASDVTDGQWALIEPLIPVYQWGRPRQLDRRAVVNAIFYIDKTGCQWALLPREYPNHNSVYHHFQRWSEEGAWEAINTAWREPVREQAQRKAQPSGASIDSQRVKTTAVGGEERGFDGGKLVKGRKRHLLNGTSPSGLDTLGNLLKVLVTAANVADGTAARQLIEHLPKTLFKRLKRLWADGGYRGEFVEWVGKKFRKIGLDITLRSDHQQGFQVVPWRWVVERSLAWLGAYRRLSKAYEFWCEPSERMIYIASIHRLLKRLAPATSSHP